MASCDTTTIADWLVNPARIVSGEQHCCARESSLNRLTEVERAMVMLSTALGRPEFKKSADIRL